jgi:CTP synthase (UTP-ammonia lyase)
MGRTMKQLIFNIKIPVEKISDLKMIYRSLKLACNLSEEEIKFSMLEDLKNRRSKVIVAEWNSEMKLFEVWQRDIFEAIVGSIETLADEYFSEIRSIRTSAEVRNHVETEMTGV